MKDLFDSGKITFLTYDNSQTTSYINEFPAAEVFRSMWGTVYTGAAQDAQLSAFALLGIDGVTIRDIHYSLEYVAAIHAAGLKVALVGFYVSSEQKVEEYIANDVDELWLDDLRSNLGKYKNGNGGLVISIPPPFEITTMLLNSISGDVTLTWNSVSGQTYRLESSVDLDKWETVTTRIPSEVGGSTTYIHSSVSPVTDCRFFRVAVEGK